MSEPQQKMACYYESELDRIRIQELFSSLNINNPVEEIFSQEQVRAGREIIDLIKSGSTSWVILLAQMQSGKTETYLFVCCELLRDRLVENAAIFSGNRETELKDQLEKELEIYSKFFKKYKKYMKLVLGMEEEERDSFLESLNLKSKEEKRIRVVWGPELTKYTGPTEKTLFIWEEAHYAQSKNQSPDKFLEKVGISADGNEEILSEKLNYVVSVSATPFSEIITNARLNQPKRIVYMVPGDNYVSVKWLRDNGKIIPFTDLTRTLTGALNTPCETPKYAIARVSDKNVDDVKATAREHGWDTVEYDSLVENPDKKKGKDVWGGMNKAPSKNTLVLIRGMCRMGKNLKKKHILFVMETSKKSNTDTVLQSLLGRVCGYPEGSDKIDIYLHETIVKSREIDQYISMIEDFQSKTRLRTMPSKAKNVLDRKTQDFEPVILQITRASQQNDSDAIRDDVLNAFTIARERIQNKNTERQLNEVVQTFMSAYYSADKKKLLHVRYLADKTTSYNFQTARDLENAFTLGFVPQLGSSRGINSKGTDINICVVKKNSLGIDTSKIYITAKTRITEHVSQIPETTDKEVFDPTPYVSTEDSTEVAEEVSTNGGLFIPLTSETSTKEDKMSEELCAMIDTSLRVVNAQRKVTSLAEGIVVSSAVQKSLEKGGKIFKHVKKTYKLTLVIKKTRGPVLKKLKYQCLNKLVSISW